MAGFRYPNESDEYRAARDALLDAEVKLRALTEEVAAQRRALPRGGKLAQDYVFTRVGPGGETRSVPFADLFADHSTLMLYSYMFGADWDAPCPSCTSLIDGWQAQLHSLTKRVAVSPPLRR